MANLLRQADKLGDLTADFEPMVESGKWAVRLLLVSLLMTPLNTLFGWRSAIRLRKPAGIWAFGFGFIKFGAGYRHHQATCAAKAWEECAFSVPSNELCGILVACN